MNPYSYGKARLLDRKQSHAARHIRKRDEGQYPQIHLTCELKDAA